MQDLQEVTQDLHYENFRSDRLKRGGRLSSHGYILPLSPAYVLVCQLALLHLLPPHHSRQQTVATVSQRSETSAGLVAERSQSSQVAAVEFLPSF